MADISDNGSLTKSPGAFGSRTRPLPRSLLLWLTGGSVGSLIFTITYLIEGATRPGYNAWQQAVSALSLGPSGWVQQANFIFFGLVTVTMAFIWHQLLKGGVGATWYPILRGLEGLGMVVDGVFSQDPAGYPQGAALLASPTPHAIIHQIFAFVCITAIAIDYFVLARRFTQEPGFQRSWAVYSVLSGLLTIFLIATFGALSSQHSAVAGLFERLATSGVSTPFGLILLLRLWFGGGFVTSNDPSHRAASE